MGGYALSIVSTITLNALSDWTQWRWQISVTAAVWWPVPLLHEIETTLLSVRG